MAENKFQCVICYENSVMTMQTPCGHKFCATCVFQTYTNANRKCPLCRECLPDKIEDYKVTQNICSQNLNFTQIQNYFPLICGQNDLEQVKYCISRGVNIHKNGIFGTPLYVSCQNNCFSTIKYLIEKGVDIKPIH